MFKFELSPEQVSASMYEINQIKTFLRPLVNGENKSIDGFTEKIWKMEIGNNRDDLDPWLNYLSRKSYEKHKQENLCSM